MRIAGKVELDDLPRICPLISRKNNPKFSGAELLVVEVGPAKFGGELPVVIAGPCAVESEEQTLQVARSVKSAGANMLRGGAFKPRTSPHDFQGLGLEGLKILRAAAKETRLPVVTEVIDVRLVETVARYVDPSHATGVASMVEQASRAAIEAGSDGLIIEVFSGRAGAERPKCDADQAIDPLTLSRIVRHAHRKGNGTVLVAGHWFRCA